MIAKRYIQYLDLPSIPDHILQQLPRDPERYTKCAPVNKNPDIYKWSDLYTTELNQWCREHICKDMYFAVQMFWDHSNMHKDYGTIIKLNYLITPGGTNVVTTFYDDDESTVLDSYCIEPHRWHVFKADTYHQVFNLEPGQIRFGVTGRIF